MTNRPSVSEKQAAKVEDVFRAFFEDVSLVDSTGIRQHIFGERAYGRNNAFLSWGDEPYQQAIEEVVRVRPKVSKKFVAKTIVDSMVKLFEEAAVREDADPEAQAALGSILPLLDRSAIAKEVDRVLDLLRLQITEWTAFVPIEGLEIKFSEEKIGKAILCSSKLGPLFPCLERLQVVDGWQLAMERVEGSAKKAGSYLAIDVEGDGEFAGQEGIAIAENVFHILNLYAASCRHRTKGYQKIGIVGQSAIADSRWSLCVEVEGSRGHWSTQVPPPRRYKITSANVKEWRDWGLDKVAESFESEDSKPTSIRSRIRRAVTWYSKGVNADSLEEQFVALATALEILLVGSEGIDPRVSWGSITQRLAERVAFLLGGDCDTRIGIARRIKELYKMRSKIVHQGEAVSRQNLFSLNDAVANTILAFVKQEFVRWDDFVDWERRQKYG